MTSLSEVMGIRNKLFTYFVMNTMYLQCCCTASWLQEGHPACEKSSLCHWLHYSVTDVDVISIFWEPAFCNWV